MEIVEKKVSELIPYENNPRFNDDAVDYVANSIKEFGFKVPIVIDKDNVIVTGHTRLKAAYQLGMETVPCIMADDLTEEQIRAYRVADNKVNEFSNWDYIALEEELVAITGIDMSDFGIEKVPEIDIDKYFDEVEPKETQPKTVTCPKCGEIIEL